MTTLEEVGFTLAGGSSVLVISWLLFGWAVRIRSPLIAPRAIARPSNVIYGNIPGSALFGWIPWTLRLSYDTLLEGIPGTGTREQGKTGSLLKVNLDGIVLLRFHAVCLRVSLLASVLFVIILVPAYLSAQCFDISECSDAYNLTDYQRTTLANVPNIESLHPGNTVFAAHDGILWRLYATVICFWIVAAYLCHELQQEWAQILAMRRVYYLEYDIWGERRKELKETMMLNKGIVDREKHLTDRDPWVPHPEQRDTVPNIALYSILVGGLPSLPEQAADSFNAEATIQFSKRESIDWQLSLTTTFFDHCVPNQPGFSSSVAAVTIIPSAMDLSIAWRKWYAAASKLRRLRFIRQQIAKKVHFEIDDVNDHGDDDDDEENGLANGPASYQDATDYGYGDDMLDYGYEESPPKNAEHKQASGGKVQFASEDDELIWNVENDEMSDNFNIYASSDYGPEQGAVYAREFAQSAAPCCPVGCNEGRLRRAGIDQLKELERMTAVEVHQANLELRAARRRATRADTNNHSEFVAPKAETINAHSCIQLGDLEGPSVAVESATARPMVSRYDRKASMGNTETAVKEDREKRLNQLGGVVSGDLGLEAKLFMKKSNDASISKLATGKLRGAASSRNIVAKSDDESARSKREYLHSSQTNFQVDGFVDAPEESQDEESSRLKRTRTKTHRRTPSTEGVELPRDIALEAQLVNESSHNSSSTTHRLNHNRLSNIPEAKDSTVSDSVSKSTKESAQVKPIETDFDETTSAHWAQVETIVTEAKEQKHRTTPRIVPTGSWAFSGLKGFFSQTKKKGKGIQKWAQQQSKEAVENLARESTYAVITFTSRQAAVAARSCLADGRGARRWVTLKEIPIPPLADAAPADLVTFRNCCRPVTLSINERQKSMRNYIAIILLGIMYIFYSFPLTAATALIDPEEFASIIPAAANIEEGERYEIALLLAGLVSASIWSTFFALCPVIFKSIAHFGSKSTSVANAEFKALQYFWWFMVLTAFSGPLITQAGLKAVNALSDAQGVDVASDFQNVLRTVARTVPSTVSISWLNWIIFRITVILPLNYLLQANSFIFQALGLHCCSRLVRGGGPGGPVPYRLYVDSGVVLMCVFSLAPASPIVALGSSLYFLFCQPLLRRNLIFMYRPKFDGGGFRWPFVFDMCISGLIMGEILLTVQMMLKQAAGPAIATAVSIVPTVLFSKGIKERYLRSFRDAALLQTSLLDGWDTATEYSVEKREEFRQFLVDAHKAAYVPVCLAGTDTDEFLTAEPAIVVHTETDDIDDIHSVQASTGMMFTENGDDTEWIRQSTLTQDNFQSMSDRRKTQHGVTLRRAVKPLAARKRTASLEAELFDKLDDDERSGISPFERSMSSRNVAHIQGQSFRSRNSSNSEEELQVRSRRPRSSTTNSSPGLIEPVSLRGRRASLIGGTPHFQAHRIHDHIRKQIVKRDDDVSIRSQLSGSGPTSSNAAADDEFHFEPHRSKNE